MSQEARYKRVKTKKKLKDKITKPLIRVFILFQIGTFVAFLP